MSGKKIFNDPVYGFISIPYGLIFDLIEHPYFQRLRRIKQVSLTHYVYPGALHTRFHHALGAFHLMTQAIGVLRSKGVEITNEEAEAASVAILLHDIGHGPFSHTLEHNLVNVHHEELSVLFMEKLNEDFDGALTKAIQIFRNEYPKPFLHQLVSSQLDMDRMDYLNRDSFFTGVYEGVIGYDRIIKMLAVYKGNLVVEEKGIYSIEKFLIARRLMYWQVYLHKTVLAAEQMLIQAFRRVKQLKQEIENAPISKSLVFFLQDDIKSPKNKNDRDRLLSFFAELDDFDVISALKIWQESSDPILSLLSKGLINRRLFKLEFSNIPFDQAYKEEIKRSVLSKYPQLGSYLDFLIVSGKEINSAYSTSKNEINILLKNGRVRPISEFSEHGIVSKIITKHFLCYPKFKSYVANSIV